MTEKIEKALEDIEQGLRFEGGELTDAEQEALATLREAIEDRDRLQHIIDCANTPLMADVLKERDELKAELKEVRSMNKGMIDLLAKREAELDAARPLLEAAMMPDTVVKKFLGTCDVRMRELFRSADAYREAKEKA